MDATFSMMAAAIYDLATRDDPLSPELYGVPDRLDREVAVRKLAALDAEIDTLTEAQSAYLTDWGHEDLAF